jgi:primosomal protein N' (replication factor Y)
MIIEVIPEKRTSQEKDRFTYLVPAELESEVEVGSIVAIPFGKYQIRGVVNRVVDNFTGDFELKPIKSVNKMFKLPPIYLQLIEWISKYYLCSLGEALSLFLPTKMVRPRKTKVKIVGNQAIIEKTLSPDQESIFRLMEKDLISPNKKPALLFGVTSSGKTEIYIKLVQETIKTGKQAIVLVPEIIMTPQTVERFKAVFGEMVAIIHSGLSKSERFQSYSDFYFGNKPIMIGPRSALMVPSPKIGLIIVDEEEDGSYKQDKNPKYHAVHLAEEIAKLHDALLVLGSATPTIESFYKANNGEYKLYELSNRYKKELLPDGQVVDLKMEMKGGNYSPISLKLQEEIKLALDNKKQIFLFLNRRGVSTFISCRECGEVIICPFCSVPLVYHLDEERHYLNCHHCDYADKVPLRCPSCQGYKIKYFGAGVEKIEKEIRELFPSATIRRIDSKTMAEKDAYHTLYDDLKSRNIDILIGTQIIAKGLDIPEVELVGVISADVGLHLPYYKAGERVFQLLTQVSGRSGRGDSRGKTIIQTYWPDSRAVMAAKEHDYRLFYAEEIEERKKYNNPPFCHLVRLMTENTSKDKALEEIKNVAAELEAAGFRYSGPAKPFLSKLRGKFRYHIIIKIKQLPDTALTKIFLANPYLFWDIDSDNLL